MKREQIPLQTKSMQQQYDILAQKLQRGPDWKGIVGTPGVVGRTTPTGGFETQTIPGAQPGGQPYKIGHIQEFKVGDETIYREYGGKNPQGQDIWTNRPELGGKTGKALFDDMNEAQKIADKMWQATDKKAALIPSVKWVNGKYEPVLLPDISQRIPPFSPAPGMFMTTFNRKTGKYVDPTTNQEVTREEGVKRFGEGAILAADKHALQQLTDRETLISTFTSRIRANVPIVLDAIKDIGNTNPRLLNQGINESKQFLMGSGKWVAAQTAILALSNEVQRVESNALGIGGQGQEERKMWAKIHDPNMTLKDWQDISKMLLKLGNTAEGAIKDQREELSKRFSKDIGLSQPKGNNITTKSGKTFIIEEVP
jgi:hypothetical protein